MDEMTVSEPGHADLGLGKRIDLWSALWAFFLVDCWLLITKQGM